MKKASQPDRVFLDTNVYIVGVALKSSPEAQILDWIGYASEKPSPVEVVASEELFDQILRVGRRVRDKDWGSEILAHMWNDLNLAYTLISEEEALELEKRGIIPREDVRIYLAARNGLAQCFISANHSLIKAIAEKTGEFESMTPEDFVEKYLPQS